MSRPVSRATGLQVWVQAVVDLLEDARADLDEMAWSWLVAILAEIDGVEVGKFVVREALEGTREAAA